MKLHRSLLESLTEELETKRGDKDGKIQNTRESNDKGQVAKIGGGKK